MSVCSHDRPIRQTGAHLHETHGEGNLLHRPPHLALRILGLPPGNTCTQRDVSAVSLRTRGLPTKIRPKRPPRIPNATPSGADCKIAGPGGQSPSRVRHATLHLRHTALHLRSTRQA
eukprot:1184682-Prorocentrum_minimum.AAC.4